MTVQSLSQAVRALLTICFTAAIMEQLTPDGGLAEAFRRICALTAAVAVYRLARSLLG